MILGIQGGEIGHNNLYSLIVVLDLDILKKYHLKIPFNQNKYSQFFSMI